jgi:uncharacterized protein YqhQ
MLDNCIKRRLQAWEYLDAEDKRKLIAKARQTAFVDNGNERFVALVTLSFCLSFLSFVALPLVLCGSLIAALPGIVIAAVVTNLIRIKLLCATLAPLIEAELGLSAST